MSAFQHIKYKGQLSFSREKSFSTHTSITFFQVKWKLKTLFQLQKDYVSEFQSVLQPNAYLVSKLEAG